MDFKKRKLIDAEMGYCVSALPLLGADRIVAASEAKGPAMVLTPPDFAGAVLATGPGGCMGFATLPGREDALLMITEFYPIFKADNAGVSYYSAANGLGSPWTGRKILSLPFVHRICVLRSESTSYLVAATVCGGKEFQDDWSTPGAVYAAEVPGNADSGAWTLDTVMEGIYRNHGMHAVAGAESDSVLISGDQGIFSLSPPRGGAAGWDKTLVLDQAVSEVFPADLDGDGRDELAVIEPFHGNAMSVYKQVGSRWQRVFSAELSFGHGLWAGSFAGERAVFVGNRAGEKNLLCFRTTSVDPFRMESVVVDRGSGTTNLDVIQSLGVDILVSSNADHGEYASYTAKGN